ncbi:magnesium-translocating P-type ATPase [Streptococcus caballi]|uniref:magnesium-translocating P-type ATPase n=1 Tax=Streptococcus caballi TaxID=439220 RepID=UPI00035ECBA1|nr:magnesium-translocating P-type ATPase [Streptococcus caballi]
MEKFWQYQSDKVLSELNTSESGLSQEEAQRRYQDYGPNSLAERRTDHILLLFFKQLKSPITMILIFAAILSILMKDMTDGIIILIIVMVSALLSFRQEYQANTAIKELLKMVSVSSDVLRDGKKVELDTTELTVGDVILLRAGDMIPADCLILESKDLSVDESSLTGETFPIEKNTSACQAETPLAKRANCLWMGTHIVSGEGKAVLVHLAKDTQFGQISKSLSQEADDTDFEKGIRQFGLLILWVTAFMIGFIFLLNILMKKPFFDSFMFALALAVGLTPQMLPAIISVNLSQGAKRMSDKDVIVKKLSAIENFGAMTVMCSDKTGTITEGKVKLFGSHDSAGQDSDFVAYLATLNAGLQEGYVNPIDQAILDQSHFNLDQVEKLDEIPYSFMTKMLSILVKADAQNDYLTGNILVSKGAFKQIIAASQSYRDANGQVADLADAKEEIEQLYCDYSQAGYRVLGLAYKAIDNPKSMTADHLTFAGFLLFSDPVKVDLPQTVARMKELGVSLKMITGDNQLIAQHVGGSIGLRTQTILTGSDIDHYSPSQLSLKVLQADIFAEINPNQKERIIAALKRSGETVGYMGDGINDAPAIKEADVGISVDTAADTAKNSASIVLLKKDLNVLIDGITEGRKTFVNTLKYIFIATSANFGNMFSMAGASLFLNFLPLLPKQILLTNLLTDFPSLQIASDSVDTEWLAAPIKWDMKFIRRFMVVFGLLSSIFDYLTFFILLTFFHAKESLFQTGWMFESILSAILVMLIVRTARPFIKSKPSRNLIRAFLVILVLEFILIFSPLNTFLGLQRISLGLLLSLILISCLYAVFAEIVKHIFYRHHSFLHEEK